MSSRAIDAARDVTLVVAMLAAAGFLVAQGAPELAHVVLGGALAFAVPSRVVSRVPPAVVPLALGVGAAVVLGGCAGGPSVALAHKVTCDAARAICAVCDATSGGSSP